MTRATQKRRLRRRRWISLHETTGTNDFGARVEYHGKHWEADMWRGDREVTFGYSSKRAAKRAAERWLTRHTTKKASRP